MDELLELNRTKSEFSRSATLCFTKTWHGEHIQDSSLHLPVFQLLCMALVTELLEKEREGRICFYINKRYLYRCQTDVLNMQPLLHTEIIFIEYKPFYSQQKFSLFILVSVYILP